MPWANRPSIAAVRSASAGKFLRNALGRMEARKVLAEDLVRGEALELPGARSPADDAPLQIKHEDGAVRYRIDQKTVAAGDGIGGFARCGSRRERL